MLSHKGGACHAGEAAGRQKLGQLHQRVVIVPVAEQHHRNGQRPRTAQPIPQPGHQQIGHPPGIGGAAHHRQIAGGDGQFPLPRFRQGIAILDIPGAQCLRQTAGNARDGLFRGAGAAEPDGVNGGNGHGDPSFSPMGRQT